MKQKLLNLACYFFLITIACPSVASQTYWQDETLHSARGAGQAALKLLPDQYRLLSLDEAAVQRQLSVAQRGTDVTSVIEIPMPEGNFLELTLTETVMMEAGLARKFPQLKTYAVTVTGRPGISGSADMTEQGFRVMLFMEDGHRLFIDTRENAAGERFYISYYDENYRPDGKTPHKCELHNNNSQRSIRNFSANPASAFRSGADLRTYRLAVSATGEYTDFHGGSNGAMSAIVTSINRVNQIYQRDLAVKMVLVNNNDQLIYTNANSDPFEDDGDRLEENQTVQDSRIGSANYDVGHVVDGGGSGGVAILGAVCDSEEKAMGHTASGEPVNDPFDIDYLAHELGHQFAADHSFNATQGGCNRNGPTAWENGNGVTIMGYAGVCDEENDVQSNSIAMFHVGNIQQMSSFINDSSTGGSCGTPTSNNNQQPQVNDGADYTIPARTPFELTAEATDADGNSLTYSWEQMDTGRRANIDVDNGGPLFRVFLPTSSPTRSFPQLNDILANTQTRGEILPMRTRQLNFTVAVRDQQGGVGEDNVEISAHDTGEAFRITSHTSGQTLSIGDSTTVSWDVAGTTSSPISCASVDIKLSTDGGQSFGTVLADGAANDGSEAVTIPNNTPNSTAARIKVKCSDNIFFDISDADLTVNGTDTPTPPTPTTPGTGGESNDQVQQNYIAYYGRPGDPAGIDYWINELDSNGGNLDAIINQFGNSPEYTERFGHLDGNDLINNIYQSLFNRSADSVGTSYYLGRLDAGSSLSNIALQILDGAQGEDLQIINNKVEVANYLTDSVRNTGRSYGSAELSDIVAIMSGITAATSSVTTAKNAVDNWASE